MKAPLKTLLSQPFLQTKDQRLVAILLGLFLVALALGLHGFSLPLWRNIIDQSKTTELWSGTYKGVRGDDWGTQLPAILAQLSHQPKFPVVNHNIGLGQNMLVLPHLPVADFFVLFRPSIWGFFLGGDSGMSWQWWSRLLALLYGFFLVFKLVSGNRFWLSLLGSLAFLFSPFVQFWAMNSAEMLASLAFSVVFATGVLSPSVRGRGLLVRAMALWWTGSVFALGFYPAFQVPLAYVGLGLVAYLSLLQFQRQGGRPELGKRLVILVGVTALIIATVGLFFLKTSAVFETILHTAYPGLRHEYGGGETVALFFSNFVNFFPHHKVYDVLVNICEAASFLFFFPLCIGASILTLPYVRGSRLPAILPVYAVLLFLLVWMFFGLPDPWPSWTLMKHVSTTRAFIGVGVLNSVLIVAYLSQDSTKREIPRWINVSILVGWSVFLLYAGLTLSASVPGVPRYVLNYSIVAMAVVGGLILYRHRWAAGVFAAVSFAMTLSFNPIVRGGVDFLSNNPLSREMKALDAQDGGKSVWLVVGGLPIGNLPRVLGLKSISGQYFYPQLDLWKHFDPEGRVVSNYNRYAHTVWEMRPGTEVSLDTLQADVLKITIDPRNSILKDLSVNYFLVQGDPGLFDADKKAFEPVFTYAENHIFRFRRPTL